MRGSNSSDAVRTNPCFQEQNQSYACLDKNGYDHKKCEEHFENYNICKKFWGTVVSDRRAKRIYPFLPDAEERERIKSDFLKSVRGSL